MRDLGQDVEFDSEEGVESCPAAWVFRRAVVLCGRWVSSRDRGKEPGEHLDGSLDSGKD